MDVVPFLISILAAFGFIAAIAGVESRDGFDRDGFGRADSASGSDAPLR